MKCTDLYFLLTVDTVQPKPCLTIITFNRFSWSSLYIREQYQSIAYDCIIIALPTSLVIAHLFKTFLVNIFKQIDIILVHQLISSEIAERCLIAVLCMHRYLGEEISYGGSEEYFNEIITFNHLESLDFCDSK